MCIKYLVPSLSCQLTFQVSDLQKKLTEIIEERDSLLLRCESLEKDDIDLNATAQSNTSQVMIARSLLFCFKYLMPF